jgi:hypothetical protein
MLRTKMFLRCAASVVVLTIAATGFSHHPSPPPASAPVQELSYDVPTDVVLGLPNGLSPASSYQGALKKGEALAADISSYPPSPCRGAAEVWNGILADTSLHGHARREALSIVLNVMGAETCGLQVVYDESTTPPTVVSLTPISVF